MRDAYEGDSPALNKLFPRSENRRRWKGKGETGREDVRLLGF